jgi:hypothetical protein
MPKEEAQPIDGHVKASILRTSSVASVKGKVVPVRTMELYWGADVQLHFPESRH